MLTFDTRTTTTPHSDTVTICQQVGQEFAEIARSHMRVFRTTMHPQQSSLDHAVENQRQAAEWYADARRSYEQHVAGGNS